MRHHVILPLLCAWLGITLPFECGRSENSLLSHTCLRFRLTLANISFSRSLRRTHRRTIRTSSDIGENQDIRHYRWMDCDVALSCVFTHFFLPFFSFLRFSLHRIPFGAKMCSQRKFIRHRHQVLLFALLCSHFVSSVPLCACIYAVRTSNPT